MRRWSACAVLFTLVMSGCPGSERRDPAAGTQLEEQDDLQPAAQSELAGMYTLQEVGGTALPVLIEERAGCRTELLDAELMLNGGRFTFTQTTRRECRGRSPVTEQRTAEGVYELDGTVIRLTTDQGRAFSVAAGELAPGDIRILELETDRGPEEVAWLFRR